MKGHGSGAEDVGWESSKYRAQEIKGPAAARGLFFLALSHRRRRQHSLGRSPSAGPATHTALAELQGVGGW